MTPGDHNVLMVQHSPAMGGSVVSGVMAAAGLVEAGWCVDVAVSGDGPARGLFEAAGCSVHLVPHCNWLAGGGVVRWTRRLMGERTSEQRFRDLIGQQKIDVVYVNTLVSLSAARAGRAMGKPVVWHVRELFDDVGGEMKVPPLVGKWVVRRALRRFPTRMVAITQSVLDNVLGGTMGYPRVEVVPNAVDDAMFNESRSRAECRRLLGLPLHVPVVAIPGMLRPMKGHPFALRAVRGMLSAHPETIVVITGSGQASYEHELRSMVSKLSIEKSVRFIGTVNDMALLYRSADVVCIPSRAEPFGRTVIESMAIGTPVVASDVGGIREILQHERTGVLTPYDNENLLAARLNLLLGNEAMRRRLSRDAYTSALDRFKRSVYVKTIDRIVREATGKDGGQSPSVPSGTITHGRAEATDIPSAMLRYD